MSRFINTTSSQDDEINQARSKDHIENLMSIIEDLDNQLTEWKNAAERGSGCDTPEGLRNFINSIESN
jgi:hypothetical protein